jgi:hypothetical protein
MVARIHLLLLYTLSDKFPPMSFTRWIVKLFPFIAYWIRGYIVKKAFATRAVYRFDFLELKGQHR